MFCIDSSVLAAYITEEPDYEKLEEFLKEGVTIELAFKEALNILIEEL